MTNTVKICLYILSLIIIGFVVNQKLQIIPTHPSNSVLVEPESVLIEKKRFRPTYINVVKNQIITIKNSDLETYTLILEDSNKESVTRLTSPTQQDVTTILSLPGDYRMYVEDTPIISMQIHVE